MVGREGQEIKKIWHTAFLFASPTLRWYAGPLDDAFPDFLGDDGGLQGYLQLVVAQRPRPGRREILGLQEAHLHVAKNGFGEGYVKRTPFGAEGPLGDAEDAGDVAQVQRWHERRLGIQAEELQAGDDLLANKEIGGIAEDIKELGW